MPEDRTELYEVCSLVVLARPEHYCSVKVSLQEIPGVDIHGEDPSGRFALTLESINQSLCISQTIDEVRNTPGVVDTALTFSHCEPIEIKSSQ